MDNIFKQAAEVVKNADALYITAGAGIGVDSGLPDFRGNEGFWKAYPPIKKLGISFIDMANPSWFDENPLLAWAFYGHRLNLYRETKPHIGFNQLLEIGESKPYGYFVFTSNVDGHFQTAGFESNKIKECHGSINHLQCTIPCSHDIWSARDTEVNINEETFEAHLPLPRCPKCGTIARPNILMFGDWNWLPDRTDNQAQQLAIWLEELKQNEAKIAIIELGAGRAVPTVRMQSQRIADYPNATLIRINPRDYQVRGSNNISIPTGAAEGIDKIVKAMKK